MKKVGILTFHDAHNYGAVLQAYALKKYIKNLGYNVKIINYHHSDIPDGFAKKRKIDFAKVGMHKFSYFDHCTRWEKFALFINELTDNARKVYTSEKDLEKLDVDYWICGSDQIWNTDITLGFNKGFFLDFETNGKKISYAVSMGIPNLEEKYEDEFKKAVNSLDCISVREETLKEYVEKFTDKKVERVVDPTLLLEPEDYEELIEPSPIVGKYLLIYALGPDERLTDIAKKIAKDKNLEIVELNDCKKNNYFCRQISNAGPEEFLSLIKYADVVVTNSFHGTIFSILFKRDFYTITRLNRNSRMENVLNIAGMRDRLIDDVSDLQNVKDQDFEKAFENIKNVKESSIDFLNSALDK